jgi:hypothetical protein
MKHDRRLRGWPFEWPDHPDEGQFRITHAKWLVEGGEDVVLDAAECLVIPASEVEFVEFMHCSIDTKEKWYKKLFRRRFAPTLRHQNLELSHVTAATAPRSDKTSSAQSGPRENGATPDHYAERPVDTCTSKKVNGAKNVKANRKASTDSSSKR